MLFFFRRLLALKFLLGINLLGFAHRRFANMELRDAKDRARAHQLQEQVKLEKELMVKKKKIVHTLTISR